MRFDEKRSSERILRYFELLKWKKDEWEDKTPQEIEERFRQELQSIEEELHTVEHLITEKSRFLLSDQERVNHIRLNISNSEEFILSAERDMIAARNKMGEYRTSFSKNRLVLSDASRHENAFKLNLAEILAQLFLGIRKDFRVIFLDIWQAIITLKISILAQYFLSILIITIIIFVGQFNYYTNTLFPLVLIALYLYNKLFSIFEKINKNQRSLYKEREDFQKEAYRQIQTLESHINDLKKRNEAQERYLVQQKIQEKELDARIQSIDNDLIILKQKQERLVEFQRNKDGEIANYKSRQEELWHLDKLTENWLEQDIEGQINKAMKKLGLIGSDYIGERGALKMDPIRSLIGCTSRTLPNQLVNNKDEDQDEDSPRRKEILERYASDAQSEDDYNGKRRRYGLYEFTVFFLSSDFFNYYKCYYNFVRGKPIDEEYSEYLYDSIVFTKVQEKSSISTQGSSQRQVSNQRLTISTNDGRLISLQINKFRGDQKLSSNIKSIDEAATEIRRMLRQRELSRDTLDHGQRKL
jgi:hypothetical protein